MVPARNRIKPRPVAVSPAVRTGGIRRALAACPFRRTCVAIFDACARESLPVLPKVLIVRVAITLICPVSFTLFPGLEHDCLSFSSAAGVGERGAGSTE